MECNCHNPYRRCRCNSTSIEPCMYCDFNMGHDCEFEPDEDEYQRAQDEAREESRLLDIRWEQMNNGFYSK